jgi:hypothetical protein
MAAREFGGNGFRRAMNPNSCLADYIETLIGQLQDGRRLILDHEKQLDRVSLQTAMYEATQIHYHCHALEIAVLRGIPP